MKYTKQPLTSRVSASQPPSHQARFRRRILILEDDREMQDQLEYVLSDLGCEIKVVDTLKKAILYLATHTIELAILDRGVPDGDGIDILKTTETHILPCIILTAKNELTERIRGLRMGAVEYLPKPFSREELKLRVQRLLQLRFGLPEQELGSQEISLLPATGQLCVHDRSMYLPRRESQLLTLLLRHPGQVLSKTQIIQQIWQHKIDQPNDETIEVYIRRLRKKLPQGVRERVETIRGFGYRLKV